ncbi:MAG TPA: hypothetical protein VMG81_05510 [Thermoplasmata archaeon]|nr:hypothetical protein [Thermoplasmata archaeon]
MASWDDFFTAQLGASAALAGLLFVGLSLNLAKILSFPALPYRAAKALTLLVLILVVATIFLVPNQAGPALGVELLVAVVGGGALVLGLGVQVARRTPEPYRLGARVELAEAGTVVALYVVAGVLTLASSPYAVYPVVPAIVISFLLAILDAWVLLVEINR